MESDDLKDCPLKGAKVGDRVGYTPRMVMGRGEVGVITSWNDDFVFVRYGDDRYSKATNAFDLTILDRKGGGDE